jgi:sodium-dependent dicarboxylate transporter 2/3/5
MWMSNTATTAMMFLGLPCCRNWAASEKAISFQRYAMAMMLVTSFAATIGGMGTLVGTPLNSSAGLLRTTAGINLTFTDWMIVGVRSGRDDGGAGAWFLIPRARHIRLGPEAVRTVAEELRKRAYDARRAQRRRRW